jgi:hypothetical protein
MRFIGTTGSFCRGIFMNRFNSFEHGALEDAQVEAILERGLPWLAVATWMFLLSVSILLRS